MGQVNIYRIDDDKQQAFLRDISGKFDQIRTITIIKTVNEVDINIGMSFYVSVPEDEKDISWNWLLRAFEQSEITSLPNPKAILLIEKGIFMYAVTYGTAYFVVDKFSDRNFSFKFARKIPYKEIKTTALTSPNSQRNKTINSYVDYNNFEFDSGESFTKIKAKVLVNDDFRIHNESIEIGNSLKFNLPEDSLESIADLIIYIEDVIENEEDKYKIPIFNKVTNADSLQTLNNRLSEEVRNNPLLINISEIEIIGTTEIFSHNDTMFKLSYRSFQKEISELTQENLHQFAIDNNFSLNECLLDIKVISYKDGSPIRTDILRNLIDYTDDNERCVLSKGQWYQFNDDYLAYLEDSIKEIDVIYNPQYNLDKYLHKEFLERKFLEEKDDAVYQGKTPVEIKKSIENKYYAERYYNIFLAETHQFINFDRDVRRIGTADIELMDLYKNSTMFAVKIGSSSGKLCYVVDQSLQALRAYKHNLIENMPPIDTVAILLVLDRVNHLPIVAGKPNINKLDMLMLKNKLDSWKKDVRVLGFKPVIYVNYIIDSSAHT
jgi:uncharacterized protein (TIGR04141 family)